MTTALLLILALLLPACPTEDSTACYFDAGTSGVSFAALPLSPSLDVLFYVDGTIRTYTR